MNSSTKSLSLFGLASFAFKVAVLTTSRFLIVCVENGRWVVPYNFEKGRRYEMHLLIQPMGVVRSIKLRNQASNIPFWFDRTLSKAGDASFFSSELSFGMIRCESQWGIASATLAAYRIRRDGSERQR